MSDVREEYYGMITGLACSGGLCVGACSSRLAGSSLVCGCEEGRGEEEARTLCVKECLFRPFYKRWSGAGAKLEGARLQESAAIKTDVQT